MENPQNSSNPNYSQNYAQNYADYSHSYKPSSSSKKKKPWLIVLIVVLSLLLIIGFAQFFKGLFDFSSTIDSNMFISPGQPYLAQMTIAGEISSATSLGSSDTNYHHRWTLSMIDEIINDPNNKGLILFVNTPGGGVYESDELYYKIMKYKKETERPVYVYMGNMAASGGYYISAPADKIYANRNTWTGSIGVIVGTIFDVSEFLEKYGIKATDITSGPNKAMGSNFAPMTDEQRAIFQSMVDESYNQFVGIVAEGRGLSVDEVKKIADGRIMTASQAKEAKLIDEVMTREEFEVAVRKEVGNEDIWIENIRRDGQTSWLNTFMGLLGMDDQPEAITDTDPYGDLSEDEAASVARILEIAQESKQVPIKYMYK